MGALFAFTTQVRKDGRRYRHLVPAAEVGLHEEWADNTVARGATGVTYQRQVFIVREPFEVLAARLRAALGATGPEGDAGTDPGAEVVDLAVAAAGELLEQAPDGPLSDRLTWCLAQGAEGYSLLERQAIRAGVDVTVLREDRDG